ncbi:Cof-type HAD-IIB family hydrolase [Microbacterium thalli]|uniref:Cof-type HAD-IIB family hydrolase n=1 Tax=Microbacterium thalli TaxID=3027921 RepID=A0ABT5SFC6_9MICO|nr:Cof-type HAD-IIB family hydrolase [Microbacterium thalli]MDD7961515.1 Cof-type HAD-IIB family hydrolase [Microbacterium thalli]
MTSPDIRLIAVDMDGTLLDASGRIPDGLWRLLPRLRERGIAFAPASGRQLATLQQQFATAPGELDYIAENGAYVMRDGVEVSSDAVAPEFAATVIDRVRRLDRLDLGLVVCGKRSAYIERADDAFHAEADKYYAKLEIVEDLTVVDDQILKLAIFDFAIAEHSVAPEMLDLRRTHQVVVSGQHWVDIMNSGVNKGRALGRLQEAMGIGPEQTMAFGDYLNDLELLQQAHWSYAMAEAHPDVAAVARYRAPSHTEAGVLTVIEEFLAR